MPASLAFLLAALESRSLSSVSSGGHRFRRRHLCAASYVPGLLTTATCPIKTQSPHKCPHTSVTWSDGPSCDESAVDAFHAQAAGQGRWVRQPGCPQPSPWGPAEEPPPPDNDCRWEQAANGFPEIPKGQKAWDLWYNPAVRFRTDCPRCGGAWVGSQGAEGGQRGLGEQLSSSTRPWPARSSHCGASSAWPASCAVASCSSTSWATRR